MCQGAQGMTIGALPDVFNRITGHYVCTRPLLQVFDKKAEASL
jgi:hypothetical protein